MPALLEEAVRNDVRAATRAAAVEAAPEVLRRIRDAFEIFDNQSALLRNSFESLKQNLAAKNQALSAKVDELQQMSSRLHGILESLADGVLVVNNDLRVERCNPVAADLLHRPRAEIEGQPYAAITNGFGDVARLRAAIAEGRPVLDDQRISVDRRGRRTVVLASVTPIRAADGAVLGAVEVLRDVTQLRALEERMQHQKRMAALGEMAASVAHEIRNPLGTIEGFARLLRHDLDVSGQPEHSRLASKIIEGTQNLNYVITNLLTYARPMSLQCEPFEIATLFQSVREVLAGCAAEAGVRLEVNVPETPVTVQGDIRQLRQVLINLGRNAVEACRRGGHVTLDAAVRAPDVVLTVADDGCGISADDLPRVFDPFFTRKEGGTGLGLSLCHKIVEAHAGEINVQSRPDVGTIVRVALPQMGGRS